MAQNKKKKKYKLRKGRVAAAAAVLISFIVLIVMLILFLVRGCVNRKNDKNSKKETMQSGSVELVDNGEYIRIKLSNCNLYVGNVLKLTCSSNPAELADRVGWSSSNPDVVSVTGEGVITVKSAGIAAITATCGVLSDSVLINGLARDNPEIDEDYPVYDIENDKLVVIQTAASDENKGADDASSNGDGDVGGDTASPSKDSDNPTQDQDTPTQNNQTQGSDGESDGEHPTESESDIVGDTVPDVIIPSSAQNNTIDYKAVLAQAIAESDFIPYIEGGYILKEDGNYLGEVVVNDSSVQFYVMMRTSGIDNSIKKVISNLLPTTYEDVYNQFISVPMDRTITADGLKVRMVAPVEGSHAQLIIYF